MSEPSGKTAVAAVGLAKSYRLGRTTLEVLKGVSFDVSPSEFVCIVGASGSGKSTLLHLLGLLDEPDAGDVWLHGVAAADLPRRRRNRIRCRDVGFVFQFYHLLGELTVLENVLLPAMVDTPPRRWLGRRKQLRDRAREVIEEVGLADRIRHRPKELSGGERQRVAIARALMNRPTILLADEPTGNLDSKTGSQIMKLLRRYNERHGQTTVMVTHDRALADEATRTLVMKDGVLVA
jgi:lipoprotein-releasing system ATP-binding protein